MELEAKYRVEDPALFDELLALPAIGPFELRADTENESQVNTYFDTPSRRFRAGRYGLRVRQIGERRIATLKGAEQVSDGLFERDEWETEIGASSDPHDWPAGDVRDRALSIAGGEPLAPIVTVHTERRHIYALRDNQQFAELSLDTGTIVAAGQELPFRELEVELLKGAERTDLETLIALLRAKFMLTPDGRSKLARGLALLDNAG